MKHWLNQHAQALSLVLGRLKKQWLGTLMICAVIGVTLTIPSLIYVIVDNLNSLVTDVKKDSQISLFLNKTADESSIQNIQQELANNRNIKHFTFVSKENALKQLIASTKNNDLIASLDHNPLPDAFFIEPISIAKQDLQQLQESLLALNSVEDVIVDSEWMNRLQSLLRIGSQAIWIFGGLLCFALIAVISNTIRMQILTHKDEIEVSELIGATKSFIRRPFLYLGTSFGLVGGLIACFTLWLVTYLFNLNVTKFAQAYQSSFSLHFNAFTTFLGMLAISASIGWLAAYLAITLKTKTKY
ncbi:MAG TPA: ABC transporter permease [Methylophilaceae bacterium]|nr:ABC transporter permease [Methylophilaceae bacterium]HAJ71456.1 ABC transporter permease [Methylophilaceae bacterium]